jgi:hypothetical protein
VRIEPRTGNQQSLGENQTRDWTSTVQRQPLSYAAPPKLISTRSYLQKINTKKLLLFSHHRMAWSQFPVQCSSNTILQIITYTYQHHCTYDRAEMRPAVHKPRWSGSYAFQQVILRFYVLILRYKYSCSRRYQNQV